MADVFLSYSSKDRAAAQRVQEALSARGIDVFWDQQTPPGQDWDTWIRGKLSACKVAIVLWSRTSVASDNVRHEALVARKAKKLLPAMIDSIAAEDLPMGLYIVQATNLADWRDPNSDGMARLIAEVEARVGKRAPGVAAISSAPAAAPARKINWIGVAIGLVAVAGAVGLTQWMYGPKDTPVSPGLISQPCSNGLPRMTTGECPGFDPTRVLTAPAPVVETFSSKILGRWSWDGLPCEEGPQITRENGRLVFTTAASRLVYSVETDSGEETRIIEETPEDGEAQRYVLTPMEADGAAGGFDLVLVDANGERNQWTRCTP